jgi:negative modulator of initiation of replication
MIKIEIDQEVHAQLAQRANGFGITPNDVLRKILNLTQAGLCNDNSSELPKELTHDALVRLISSPHYKNGDAKERYFSVLKFLYEKDSKKFSQELESFSQSKRVHFSKDPLKIEKSGESTKPVQLRGTPFYVLTNLSNHRKRSILGDVLRLFDYPKPVIERVLASIPDSSIKRAGRSFLDEYDL